MRYIMKGGVWKNSQDEILKAAIMKYGLNQWSRISSLLQRKSAKQCKQRWYEWLDPSIKKTQWSRTEDEKLLQLARVFPSQWRTIAPFVGRTPTQCFERYQKLLDLAQGKNHNESEDLKKLRPGEIDPNPETKPAKLDPIDMDEDEKEMLAEVRVRLANTKGKKAKRKEREKIIEEARRLAQLQKIRELEMAGVDNIPTAKQIKRMRQKKDIDYNREIPFKRDVPEFSYKLEENETPKNTFFASTISLQTLQGKRRDVEEELQRKLDKKRVKKLKDRDLKSVLQLKNDFDKPAAFPISLPEPQLNDQDIQNMRKFNITTPLNTNMLQTPLDMTPENKVMFSARVNLSLNHPEMMTPGQQQVKVEMDGVQGLRHLKEIDRKEKDPNKIRSVDRLLSERVKTPSKNEWEREEGQIKSLFKGLKKPENLVQFQIPQQEEEQQDQQELDAEEIQRIQLEKQRIQEENRLSERSEVLKRGLPRPTVIPSSFKPPGKNAVKKLIEEEMVSMLYSDAIDYPYGSVQLPEEQIPYTQPLNKEIYSNTKDLIDEELENISIEEKKKIEEAYQKQKGCIKYNKKANEYFLSQEEPKGEMIEQEENEVQMEYKKKVEHNEKKVKKYLTGYERLIDKKVKQINDLEKELQHWQMERVCLETLRQKEKNSMSSRLANLESFYKLVYNSL